METLEKAGHVTCWGGRYVLMKVHRYAKKRERERVSVWVSEKRSSWDIYLMFLLKFYVDGLGIYKNSVLSRNIYA